MGESRAHTRWRSHWRLVACLGVLFALSASCGREATKSDYVSAQVGERCAGKASNELQSCRIAVIRAFADVPFEDMKKRYPEPELRDRPSCAL